MDVEDLCTLEQEREKKKLSEDVILKDEIAAYHTETFIYTENVLTQGHKNKTSFSCFNTVMIGCVPKKSPHSWQN